MTLVTVVRAWHSSPIGVTLSGMSVDLTPGKAYCVLRFKTLRLGYPKYAVVLHDSSVAPLVDRGEVVLVETGLPLPIAQKRAITLNMEGGEQ